MPESKFYHEPNPEAQQAAYRAEEQRRAMNRSVGMDPWVVCAACGWKIRESRRVALGVQACQRCGNRQCRIENMDYDSRIPVNPTPTYEQALADEQSLQAKRRQIIGGP